MRNDVSLSLSLSLSLRIDDQAIFLTSKMYVEKLTITFQGSKDQKSSERTSRRCAATKNALEKSHLLRTVRIRPCKHSLVVFSHSHRVAATCRIFQHRARQGRRQICRSSPHGTSSFRCKSAPPGARISFKPVHGFICPPKYRRSYVADTRSCISSKSHCLIGWNNSRGAFCSLTRTPVRGRRHITDANSGRGKRAGKSMNYATSRAVTTVIYRQFDRGTRKICNIYIYIYARTRTAKKLNYPRRTSLAGSSIARAHPVIVPQLRFMTHKQWNERSTRNCDSSISRWPRRLSSRKFFCRIPRREELSRFVPKAKPARETRSELARKRKGLVFLRNFRPSLLVDNLSIDDHDGRRR